MSVSREMAMFVALMGIWSWQELVVVGGVDVAGQSPSDYGV